MSSTSRITRSRAIAWSYAELMLLGAQKRGADPDRLLRRAGLRGDRPPPFLTEVEFSTLLRCITRATGDEFWGLAPEPMPLGTFDALCRTAARERTLEGVLKSGARVLRIAFGYAVVRVSRDEGALVVAIAPRRPWSATSESALLFLVYGLACWLVGRPLPLERVEMRGEPSPQEPTLNLYYRAPARYAAARTRLLLPEAALDWPVVIDGRRLEAFIGTAPLGLVARYRDPLSIAERLKGLLQRNPGDLYDLAIAARALSVTPQTLQRKLAAEGVSFRIVKDEVLRDLAIDLLADRRHSLDDIAIALGFSEHSSFHRAFRRWTGLSPGAFRPPST